MNKQRRWIARAALALGALACGATVSASVDTSAKPGGIYPLKPGVYVARGSDCEAPARAALRRYDGHGINTAHSHTCRATILARKAGRSTVDQRCIGAGSRPGRRQVERQLVVVRDALTFTQTIGGVATTYRYCAPYQLPRAVRQSLR